MALATPDLITAVSDLLAVRGMTATLSVSGQCGLIASASTMLGGVLAGPLGITVGSLLGAVMASYHAKGKFKSVPDILINETSAMQKEKLADSLRKILSSRNIVSVVQFIALTQSDKALLQLVMNLIKEVVNEMGYKI